jgi:hypothetical protein
MGKAACATRIVSTGMGGSSVGLSNTAHFRTGSGMSLRYHKTSDFSHPSALVVLSK